MAAATASKYPQQHKCVCLIDMFSFNIHVRLAGLFLVVILFLIELNVSQDLLSPFLGDEIADVYSMLSIKSSAACMVAKPSTD